MPTRKRVVTISVVSAALAVACVCGTAFFHINNRRELAEVQRRTAPLTNELADCDSELAQATILIAQLKRDLQAAEDARKTPQPPPAVAPAEPLIEAKVLAVKPEAKLAMLSAGSNDGVKPGYHFMIHRKDQYIATVQVDKVWPDMSSARVILEGLGQAIEKNDNATTRWPGE